MPRAHVIVVGAGAAGLSAALCARVQGADVTVYDSQPADDSVSTTALSAGLIPAAGTAQQRRAGISDHPERHAQDIMVASAWTARAELVDTLTNDGAQVIAWLEDQTGHALRLLESLRLPGHSAARMHEFPGAGAGLEQALRAAAVQRGIVLQADSEVTGLRLDPREHVVGVQGDRWERTGSATVVCSGGFAASRGLVARHIPHLAAAALGGSPTNTGSAVQWADQVEAELACLRSHQAHPLFAVPGDERLHFGLLAQGGLIVDSAGSIVALGGDAGPNAIAAGMVTSRGQRFLLVTDAGVAEQFKGVPRVAAALESASCCDGRTFDEQVDRLSIPRQTLSRSLAAWQRHRLEAEIREPAPLTSPLLAWEVRPALYHTQGGLRTDTHGCVTRIGGDRLTGLFAAGGAAAGISGDGRGAYLPGNGLLGAIGMGRRAGYAAGSFALSGL